MPRQTLWMDDWHQDCWLAKTERYRPNWRIPDSLIRRFGASTSSPGAMPASIQVRQYSVKISYSKTLSQYGHPGTKVDLKVDWHDDTAENIAKRSLLLGDVRPLIDEYHSRAAFATSHTLLNEVQRKINRTRDNWDRVQKIANDIQPDWKQLLFDVIRFCYENLEFNLEHILKYTADHKKSSVIPGTWMYRSRKWPQLTVDEFKYLFNLVKAYLEWLLGDWETNSQLITKSEAPGRGRRARSAVFKEIKNSYSYEYDRTRQIVFMPYWSTWFAFLTPATKIRLWKMIRDRAEDILSCKVLLPPLEKGSYWQTLMIAIEEGNEFANGDGVGWDAWTGVLMDCLAFAVNDGVPQFATGAAPTSLYQTIATLALSPQIFGDTSKLEIVAAMGDDLVGLGKVVRPKEILDVWEVDKVATDNRIVLGIVLLAERKGTFPGYNRITVDQGDKGFNIDWDTWNGPIKGTASTQAEKIYFEIMTEGTLFGVPLVDRVAMEDDDDFWEGYRGVGSKSRHEMLATLPEPTVEV